MHPTDLHVTSLIHNMPCHKTVTNVLHDLYCEMHIAWCSWLEITLYQPIYLYLDIKRSLIFNPSTGHLELSRYRKHLSLNIHVYPSSLFFCYICQSFPSSFHLSYDSCLFIHLPFSHEWCYRFKRNTVISWVWFFAPFTLCKYCYEY